MSQAWASVATVRQQAHVPKLGHLQRQQMPFFYPQQQGRSKTVVIANSVPA